LKRTGLKAAHIYGFGLGFTGSIIYFAVAAAYSLGAYLIVKNLFGVDFEGIMLVFGTLIIGAQSVGNLSV
jgi:hypothetical protein